jgi:hypothetical protein
MRSSVNCFKRWNEPSSPPLQIHKLLKDNYLVFTLILRRFVEVLIHLYIVEYTRVLNDSTGYDVFWYEFFGQVCRHSSRIKLSDILFFISFYVGEYYNHT